MPTTSFNQLAQQADALYPPQSMHSLLSRLRYPGAAPGTTLPTASFAEAAWRLSGPSTTRISFLHYNIWCLRAKIGLKEIVAAAGGVGHFAACLGVSSAEFIGKALEMIGADIGDVCDRIFPPIVEVCGVSANPLNDACKLVGNSLSLGGYIIENLSSDLDWLISLFSIPEEVVFEVLMQLVAPVLGVFEVSVMEKPVIPERAGEIGRRVFAYDLVSLVEAWDQDTRDTILAHGTAQHVDGPTGSLAYKQLQSGILVLSPTRTIENGGGHVYAADGVSRVMPGGCEMGYMFDSDKWANKGVQLTRIPVGFGAIELYSTHVYAGDGGLLPPGPTDAEKIDVRRRQIDELIAFIKATHLPSNVAIVAGDFNIGADTDEYHNLVAAMEQAGFYDLWSVPYDTMKSDGLTDRHGEGDEPIYNDFNTNCKVYRASEAYRQAYDPAVATPTMSDDVDYYCDDMQPDDANPTGSRIDYLFMERATAFHGFNLDVSRVRRRAFKSRIRWVVTPGPQDYLSNHIGLEATLFASSRH
ncbi:MULTISPECIES: endonuclease/exonuclease/phosphatase family protein [unclassified Bradyrhizobium]|uniref:endonuclease/exonuclease/phosphatase family protein n=1 Tax=Bradyrhizobium TaxID=374 RepID=UPI0028EB00DD|nr:MULTISPECIES: endonuclease/exonuclease/phosphatase family protein [unclassified Bradyrhizobium]